MGKMGNAICANVLRVSEGSIISNDCIGDGAGARPGAAYVQALSGRRTRDLRCCKSWLARFAKRCSSNECTRSRTRVESARRWLWSGSNCVWEAWSENGP